MRRSRPIKVLQIVDTLGMGGAETWLMEVLRLWSKTGACQIDFVATSGNPGIFDDEARQLGAQVHYLRYGRAHLTRFVRKFRQLLRDGKYDAIHDHQDYASGWHFLMGRDWLPKIRVTHVHNPSYQILKQLWRHDEPSPYRANRQKTCCSLRDAYYWYLAAGDYRIRLRCSNVSPNSQGRAPLRI